MVVHALFAIVVAALAGVHAATAAAPSEPARVQVSADEFTLVLSRLRLRPGPAIIQLVNYGEDDHDLAVRRAGGTVTRRLGIVRPGGLGELEARLLPGRYTLWCTLADHRALGMSAGLVVAPVQRRAR